MTKIFRKLRMTSKNSTRYLKYAVGEIALVVTGILIALAINNWNQHRKDRIKEQKVLKQLKTEYQSNLEQLNSKIQIRNRMKASGQRLLHFMNHPNGVSSDSILYHLGQTGYRPTFDPIKNDIVNTEKLSLIQNDSLRVLLSQWETNVYQLNEEEWFWRDFVIEVRLPFLIENHLTRKVSYFSQHNFRKYYLPDLKTIDNNSTFEDTNRTIDFRELLNTAKLESIAVASVFSATDANVISGTLKENIETIQRLIDQEIKP